MAEQHTTNNDCGVHAIMFIEALALKNPKMEEQALATINPVSVPEKRRQVSEWFKQQLTEDRDTDFIDYLQRGIR